VELLRNILSVLLGAMVGVMLISLVVFSEFSRFTFGPLPFAVLGTALIATAHAALVELGLRTWLSYLLAPLAGAVAGAALLGLDSGMDPTATATGAQFGFACAAAWAALDVLLKRLFVQTHRT